jgi:hypothetical protein
VGKANSTTLRGKCYKQHTANNTNSNSNVSRGATAANESTDIKSCKNSTNFGWYFLLQIQMESFPMHQ